MEKQYIRGTTGDAQTDAMLRNIYTVINELIDFIATKQQGEQAETNSVRVVKQSDNTYIVAVKSEDGWLVSDGTSATGFRFQTKLD